MAIKVRASATNVQASLGTNTVNRPTGTIDGDTMVTAISVSGGSGTTITPPAGWTLIRRDDSGTTISLALYSRVASSETATYVWTFSGTPNSVVGVVTCQSGDQLTATEANAGQSNVSALTDYTAVLQVLTKGALVIAAFAHNDGVAGSALDAGLVSQFDAGSGGVAMRLVVGYRSQARATSYGPFYATFTVSAVSLGAVVSVPNSRRSKEEYETVTLDTAGVELAVA